MKEIEAQFHLFLTSTQDGGELINSRPYRSTHKTQKFDGGVGRRAGPDTLNERGNLLSLQANLIEKHRMKFT
jgi:hypothetical protein